MVLLIKKGQISIFIVIGLIVVLFSVLLYNITLEKEKVSNSIIEKLDISTVDSYVYSCYDASIKKAILNHALQGGMYDISNNVMYNNISFMILLEGNISYFNKEKSIKNLYVMISESIYDNCLDIDELKNKGLDINYSIPDIYINTVENLNIEILPNIKLKNDNIERS